MLRGEQRQLQAAGHAELLEDVRQVVLDRLLADGERLGDLLVPRRFDDERDDLELALRQAERGQSAAPIAAGAEACSASSRSDTLSRPTQ